MDYRKNYVSTHRLSLNDLDGLIKILEEKQANYTEVVKNVAERVADDMLTEVNSGKYKSIYGGNPYRNTTKEVTSSKSSATAKITNHDNEALFYEMGTGVVGSSSPAPAEYIKRYGWVYDHHGHGDEGWWYPTTADDPNPYKWTDPSGQLRAWTRGLSAMNGFYNASKQILDNIKDITLEEIKKM